MDTSMVGCPMAGTPTYYRRVMQSQHFSRIRRVGLQPFQAKCRSEKLQYRTNPHFCTAGLQQAGRPHHQQFPGVPFG